MGKMVRSWCWIHDDAEQSSIGKCDGIEGDKGLAAWVSLSLSLSL